MSKSYNGIGEELYERALTLELAVRQIPFERQRIIQVSYKGQPLGIYRLHLVVADQIILELKATGLRLGILINFGTGKVQSERIVN